MFPYRDDNPTLATPVVTFLIIGLNVAAWILIEGMGTEPGLSRSVCQLGLIPGEFLGTVSAGTTVQLSPGSICVLGDTQTWYTPVTSMFLHGGWFHLLGNMWFLWLFGNNVEDSMGRLRYAAFYLLCGLAAAAAQTVMGPSSVVPMVGASGAISGVMGAYVILYPTVRVHMLVVLVVFITRIAVPAYLMLGYWFLLQLLGGVPPPAKAAWHSGRTSADSWPGPLSSSSSKTMRWWLSTARCLKPRPGSGTGSDSSASDSAWRRPRPEEYVLPLWLNRNSTPFCPRHRRHHSRFRWHPEIPGCRWSWSGWRVFESTVARSSGGLQPSLPGAR